MQKEFDENEKEENSTNGNQALGINNKPTVLDCREMAIILML
jgi:hypothetical protein